MSLTFEDFERDYPVAQEKPKQESKSTPAKPSAPSVPVKPSFGEAMGQVWDKTRPVIEAGVQRAVNPFHYTGDQEDYANIDWTKTAAHAGAEAVAAKRLWDFATGKSAERETERMNAETNRMNAEINRQNAQAKNAPQRTITPVPQPQPQANVVAAPGPATPAPQPSPSQTFEQNRLERQRNAQASIEGRMIAPKAEPAPVQPTFTPENVPTAEQETKKIVESGKLKGGKEFGSISPIDATIMEGELSGKGKAEVADVVKGAAAPKSAPPKTPKAPPDNSGLTKEQAGLKKYLTSFYGGGAEGEKAYQKVEEILGYKPAYEPGKGGGLNPKEVETIKAWRKENLAGPKINLTHDMKKAMKGAGGIAVLAAIPGFAEAAQRKDFGAMTDIATDFAVLPFAQSREAGMPKAQEESIIAQKFKEAQKLGSPYRSVPPPR